MNIGWPLVGMGYEHMHMCNREIKLHVNPVFAKVTLILDQVSSWPFIC